jgi:type I restriction enzyme S subunit
MSDWLEGQLGDSIAALDAGVSVNAEDRPHGAGEIGVLKTSAVSGGRFLPEQNKTVVEHEKRFVAEPVLEDSILVSRMNTPALVGESCFVREAHPTLFLPDRLWQLKPKDRTKISMRWLSFILQSAAYRRYVELHATGTSGSMKNLPKSKLFALPVSYPTTSEQTVVAQILDTLDVAIHETEAIIAKLNSFKQGLLHDLLTRGIDANGELRPPQTEAPHLYKESPLGWISKEWSLREGRQCFDLYSGSIPIHVRDDGLGAFNYYKVEDFNNPKNTNGLAEALVTFDLKNQGSLQIFGGDYLVFPKRGAAILQNRVQLLAAPGTVDPNLMVLKTKSEISPAYFREVLIHFGLHNICDNSGIPQINNKHLLPLTFAVPNGHEQSTILEPLKKLHSVLGAEKEKFISLQRIKVGLMDDLLTGRVRVTPLLGEYIHQQRGA